MSAPADPQPRLCCRRRPERRRRVVGGQRPFADKGYQGAGCAIRTPFKRPGSRLGCCCCGDGLEPVGVVVAVRQPGRWHVFNRAPTKGLLDGLTEHPD